MRWKRQVAKHGGNKFLTMDYLKKKKNQSKPDGEGVGGQSFKKKNSYSKQKELELAFVTIKAL